MRFDAGAVEALLEQKLATSIKVVESHRLAPWRSEEHTSELRH